MTENLDSYKSGQTGDADELIAFFPDCQGPQRRRREDRLLPMRRRRSQRRSSAARALSVVKYSDKRDRLVVPEVVAQPAVQKKLVGRWAALRRHVSVTGRLRASKKQAMRRSIFRFDEDVGLLAGADDAQLACSAIAKNACIG